MKILNKLLGKNKDVIRIDELIKEVEAVNPEAGGIIKKRRNLLERSNVKTPYELVQTVFRTYSEGISQSTHIQVPPSEQTIRYYADQLTFYKADGLAPEYRKTALELQALDTELRKTDKPIEESLNLFIEFDKSYNRFLDIHAKTLKRLANPPKDTYQTGIQ